MQTSYGAVINVSRTMETISSIYYNLGEFYL